MNRDLWDVVAVGGGAAGLSGAVALTRARRSVLVVDAGRPRNRSAGQVHSYLGFEGGGPADLLATGRRVLRHYGGHIVTGCVTAATALPDRDGAARFRLMLAGGKEVSARRLLIAAGVVDELSPIAGMKARWGRDVVHCPYCHGREIRDQPIGVLGSNCRAAGEALLIRQWSPRVTLFTHTAPALNDDDLRKLHACGIRVLDAQVQALQIVDDELGAVRPHSGQTVACRVLAVMPHSTVNAPWLTGLGLRPTDQIDGGRPVGNYLATGQGGATAIDGVWAAGNVADLSCQVISAASAGLTAGTAINADLVVEDTRLAMATLSTPG